MRRKNTRRFDPRYFMDEKTEKPKVIKEALTDRNPADFHPDYLDTGVDPQDVQRWNDTALPGLPRWVPALLSKLGLARPFYQSDEEYEAALTDMFGEEMAMAIAAEEPMAEGQALAEISGDTDWKQANQQIQSAKNALQMVPPDVERALLILEDLLGLYPKFDIK